MQFYKYIVNVQLDPKCHKKKYVLVIPRGIQALACWTCKCFLMKWVHLGAVPHLRETVATAVEQCCASATGGVWFPGVRSEHIDQVVDVVHLVLQFSLQDLRHCMLIYSNLDAQNRAAWSRTDEMACKACFPLVIPFHRRLISIFLLIFLFSCSRLK